MIPRELRERFRFEAGTAVSFEARDEGVLVRREDHRGSLKGRFRGSGMAALLLEDRRLERD